MARETKVTIAQEGNTFTISFGADIPEVSYTLDPANPVYNDLAVFGVVNKIRNACGGSVVSQEEAQIRVAGLVAAWVKGEFNMRGSGEGGAPTGGLLAQALANLSGKALADCIAFVGAMDKKTQAAMRADADIAAEIARIKPTPKAKEVSGDVASALKAFLQK